MKSSRPRLHTELEMEMTPMVDVVFQLLVFFIFSFQVRVLERYYRVHVPASERAPAKQDEQPPRAHLEAGPDGQLLAIVLDGTRLATVEEFEAALRQRAPRASSDPAAVLIKPVGAIKYQHVVAVAEAARRMGWGISLLKVQDRTGATGMTPTSSDARPGTPAERTDLEATPLAAGQRAAWRHPPGRY